MASWVRYPLVVSVIGVSGLLVWLTTGPDTHPTSPRLESLQLTRYPLRKVELRFPIEGHPRRPASSYQDAMDIADRVSKPSYGDWRPYAEAVPVIMSDAERLWQSGLLESLWVDATEERYPNGGSGVRVVFNFVERDGDVVVPTVSPRVPDDYEVLPMGTERLYPR